MKRFLLYSSKIFFKVNFKVHKVSRYSSLVDGAFREDLQQQAGDPAHDTSQPVMR